ncbi:MAG TPA: PLDc N-terminal domain-containing protein [Acidimicrobiales bacterium]|nr:PLDc N-terminal domain-containing protein [Acidimicrobiales bacterium]
MRALDIPLAVAIPVVVIVVGFAVYCLLDLQRAPRVRWLPKWAWAIVCVISIPLGGLVYLAFGKPVDNGT